MKDQIIKTSTEMFFKLGFKSVTMDDIASRLAISKKTLYKNFSNKEELIISCSDYIHKEIHSKFEDIIALKKNAIEENFILREMFNDMFKTDGDAPLFQLKKHYPLIFHDIRERESIQCESFFFKILKKELNKAYIKRKQILNMLFYFITF